MTYRPSSSAMPLPSAWGCTIAACSGESIGSSIAKQGVYDLPLTEAIVRLTNPGDTTLDIGANIGYMSFVLSQSAGPAGRVLSFEPNPSILPTLRSNVSSWKSLHGAPIQIEAVALSDRDGDGVLGFPVEYASNNGVASLELDTDGVPVSLRRLDSVVGRAGVMKVDVEGHETAVFSGAEKLLARKLIRDILFEEHDTYPATSHKILLGYGYHLFRVTRSLWRPLLLPPEEPARQTDFPSNYLATKEPARARFAGWGWKALSTKCGSFPPAG